jgi:hypothetical protein
MQEGSEPRFIEKHFLMSCFPELTDLFRLASGRKDLLLDSDFDKVFEVVGFRITAASLPFADGSSRDAKEASQPTLGQAECRTQGQHHLTESIVLLAIRKALHRSSLLSILSIYHSRFCNERKRHVMAGQNPFEWRHQSQSPFK